MPLRYVRTRSLKVSTGTALSVAITTTSIASELADIAQFPPVRAAATILLVIFQTIQASRHSFPFMYCNDLIGVIYRRLERSNKSNRLLPLGSPLSILAGRCQGPARGALGRCTRYPPEECQKIRTVRRDSRLFDSELSDVLSLGP